MKNEHNPLTTWRLLSTLHISLHVSLVDYTWWPCETSPFLTFTIKVFVLPLPLPYFHFSPQFIRKSTDGVSYFLFALVILGNTTYGLSVLLKNPDNGDGERSYLVHHLPWLIGSLGTLSLDVAVSFTE